MFGVSSSEYLGYAEANRKEWVKKGEKLVQVYLERFKLRESVGSGDFGANDFASCGDLRMDESIRSLSDSVFEPELMMDIDSAIDLPNDDECAMVFEIEC